jgi:hypothetical protein
MTDLVEAKNNVTCGEQAGYARRLMAVDPNAAFVTALGPKRNREIRMNL